MNKLSKAFMLLGTTAMLCSPLTVLAYDKKETVYTNLNYDGSIERILVSNHLSKLNKEDIEDETTLKDILNISGDEKFEQSGSKLSWKSKDSNEIFYQGITEASTPIKVEVKYYLNDEEKDISEIEGKSGDIKIELNFKNTLENKVTINGKKTTIYTPFVTTVGTIVKDSTNADITNGKVVSTGNKNVFVGIASPGLYDSLQLDEVKNFDSITLSYSTNNFKLSDIYIVSTPKLIEDKDLTIFDKLNTVYADIDKLQTSMDEIENGADQLLNGSKELDEGTKTLVTSLKKIKNATSQLSAGSNKLNSGVTEIVDSLTNAQKELQTKQKDIQELQRANKKYMTESLTELQTLLSSNQVANIVFNKMVQGYVAETHDDITNKQVAEKALIVYKAFSTKSTSELMTMFGEYTETAGNVLTLCGKYYIFYANYTTINSLSTNLSTLTNSLTSALTQVQEGTKTVSNGLTQVNVGINKIYEGSVTLNNGTSKLVDGTENLYNGIKTYNQEGINRLTDYKNDIKTSTDKIEELKKLSKNYKGYASNNATNTTFIYTIKKAGN
ncbi:MAG: hypothetical protein K6E99_02215 [Bacilli bacterium]|nr:hypothetical protein [Bacilli bacterium]